MRTAADSGFSNADYTVLVALFEAAGGRLRAFELGRRPRRARGSGPGLWPER
jgi:hypothetical protein